MFIAAALATAQPAPAAEAADPCAVAGACRDVGEVTISLNGELVHFPVNWTMPWVIKNNLVLYPGDTAVIGLPLDQEGQLPITLAATGEAAETRELQPGEIRFTLKATEQGTMLQATSAHPRWLHYMAVMTLPQKGGKTRGAKTSICPVMAGKMGFEMWQDPIIQLALTNFTPVGEGNLVCR